MLELRNVWSTIENSNTLTIPCRLSFFLGYENRSNKYVTLFANIGKGKKGQEYRWLIKDLYPFPRSDLNAVIEKFALNYIVVERAAVEQLNNRYDCHYYNFENYFIAYENSHYIIYSVTNGSI